MGMTHGRVLGVDAGGEAVRVVVGEGIAVEAAGLSATLADTDVLETRVTSGTGHVLAKDNTNGDSHIFSLHTEAGVLVLAAVAGSTNFSATKDTASKINVYVEAGEVKVQNLLGADTDVNISAQL